MAKREKQQISWNTAPVMARYRELLTCAQPMSSLAASKLVLKEAEERTRRVGEGL